MNSDHVKILFEIDDDNGSVTDVESMWARRVTNGFAIDNIPFYARAVSCGDIVDAQPDRDGLLRFVTVVHRSGHSTLRLWFADAVDVGNVRRELHQRGCRSEIDVDRLIAVDVPTHVDYGPVRTYLEDLEAAGVLEYEESCLMHR